MQERIDLHIHSTASDGTFSPSEIAQLAKKSGLYAVALTDHDTVSGIEEFMNECKKLKINGIAGTELSAKYSGEMHIVGLFLDYKNQAFLDKLYNLEHAREIRNIKMIEHCNELGFEMTQKELLSQKEGGTLENIGRPHFARVFVNRGYAADINDAFNKYFAKGKMCYIEKETYSPKDIIRLIHEGGGIAILAHPFTVTRDMKELREILTQLKQYGLDGMECRHSDMEQEFADICEKLCEEFNLLKSGGSDFHGANKKDIHMGTGKGSLYVPVEYLEQMKRRNL